MQPLASFNGGPSQGAIILAVAVACVIGILAGRYSSSKVQAFLIALLGSVTACSLCIYLGNQQGDMAGIVLYGALLIFCPVLGILSGLLALVVRWVLSHR